MSPIIDATDTPTGSIANSLKKAKATRRGTSSRYDVGMSPASASITGPVAPSTQTTTPRITDHFLSNTRLKNGRERDADHGPDDARVLPPLDGEAVELPEERLQVQDERAGGAPVDGADEMAAEEGAERQTP